MAKDKKKDKEKGKKGRVDEVEPHVDAEPLDTAVRLATHPKAQRQIRATKAWAGLIVFLLVQYLALSDGMSFVDAGVRALLAGIAAYLIAWAVAVIVWRQIVVAEVELLRRELLDAAERAAAEQADEAPAGDQPAATPEPSFS